MAICNKIMEMDKIPRDYGVDVLLTREEVHLVSAVAENEGTSVTDLARIKGVTKGAVSQMLSRLEKKGLIEKEPDPANVSRLLIQLTPKGRLADQGHQRVHEVFFNRFLAEMGDIDEASLDFLHSFLGKVDWIIDNWDSLH